MSSRGAASGDGLSDAARLAAEHGLTRVGARPPLGEYLRQVWARRAFLWALASGKSYSRNQNNYLGQVWAVLNPLMLAAVYYVVFGRILGTDRGIENYVGFLVIGIFIFQFIAGSITAGSGSITGNMSIVRALHFPRAVLPLSVAVAELLNIIPALVVMMIIVLVTGEPVTLEWLVLIPVVLMIILFNAGCGMIAARLIVVARDLKNIIPIAIRLLRYVSGVFFSIEAYSGDTIGGFILKYQPVSVFIELVRACLLDKDANPEPAHWYLGVAWALVMFVVGFIVFWRAEERYGRD